MTTILAFATGIFATLAVAGLARRFTHFLAQVPDDYADLTPPFDIRQRLNGDLVCDGVIYGPTGRVASRFFAEFEASWNGDTGRMIERFHYDSGAMQLRCWHLKLDGGGAIRATADDVVGTGRGRQEGSSVQMTYRIKLPDSAGGHVLDVVDWMYLLDSGVIVNRSQFRKFGIKVAELVATIRPVEQSVARQDVA